MNLNDVDKRYLIDLIGNNEQIPEDYKYFLFPTMKSIDK